MIQANNQKTPEAKDWNYFWKLDQTDKFTKISWSKRRIIEVLKPFIKKDGWALDAGCGSGFFSKYFCENGMKTVSLDYSKEALVIAERLTQGKAKIFQDDLLIPGLSLRLSQRFDLIFTDGLFEHFSLDDQDKIFNNLKSVMSAHGVIVTFVPNRWSPWELIRPLYMPGIDEKPFVLSELKLLNTRNGLKIINEGGLNTFPFSFSPDTVFGKSFGMLLYTIAQS